MAGHSKFKKIKHKKESKDNKRCNEHTRVSKEIIIAARIGGGDPKMNPRLRLAMLAARQANFPKAKVDDAIKKGLDPSGGELLEEVRFEGFGPSGVAVLVEAVTSAKQAKIEKSVVKKTFLKNGGTLGEEGCVSHLFQRLGLIVYPVDVKPEDDMLLLAIEQGAEDCQKVDDEYEIFCSYESLHTVRDALENSLGEPSSAKPIWKPNNPVILDHKKTKTVLTLIDCLEDLESVQDVWSNIDIPDDYIHDNV